VNETLSDSEQWSGLLPDLLRHPVTGLTSVAAIGVTIAYWSGWNINPLLTNSKAFGGEPWRLVTSALPHTNFLHLLFNLYWLVHFGKLAEPRFGWWRTAGLYSLLEGTRPTRSPCPPTIHLGEGTGGSIDRILQQ